MEMVSITMPLTQHTGTYIFSREVGTSVTLERKKQSLEEGRIYRRWFSENVLKKDRNTASSAVLIMPLSCYAPDYRDNIHE